MLRNFHATSCSPLGSPGFYPELRLAPKSTGAEGGVRGMNRSCRAQAPAGKCREADGRKEGLAWSSERRGQARPGALESHTALESLPRPGPTALGMQGWV